MDGLLARLATDDVTIIAEIPEAVMAISEKRRLG